MCGATPLALRTTTEQGLVIAGAGRANACVHARDCAFVSACSEGLPPLCRNYAALHPLRRVVPCARLFVRWAIPTRGDGYHCGVSARANACKCAGAAILSHV